jgi:hypothetical protein
MRILSDVIDHVFAIQVIHKRNDPKLPYQAVVIRQSAMHRKGRNATADGGGVDPHSGSGSIPRPTRTLRRIGGLGKSIFFEYFGDDFGTLDLRSLAT